MKFNKFYIVLILFIITSYACRKPILKEENIDNWDERMSGGEQTVLNDGVGAFSQVFNNLNPQDEQAHDLGDLAFEATFVTAPALINSGLGPIYNNTKCSGCHINDGRGKVPKSGEDFISMLVRLSLSGRGVHGENIPVPFYGTQLQNKAIFGKQPEAKINLTFIENVGKFIDEEEYSLRNPIYTFTNTYMPLPSNVQYSPRIAPPVFGLGLLEAISEQTMLNWADEFDANNDGISGKINYVWDIEKGNKQVGKFGWKAGQPNLKQQTASAYAEDMGITNPLFTKESSYGQFQYDNMQDDAEINDSILTTVAFYMASLAVPARRNVNDIDVLAGKKIFNSVGCASCHKMTARTSINMANKYVNNQLIFPFTDLLLHDLGVGLADNRAEFEANGNEWRTAPLWGIGLTQKINGHSNFLHDGRARNLTEAILWHGGEAESTTIKFKSLPKTERLQLIKFLDSL